MAVSLPFRLVKSVLHLLADRKRKSFIEACKNPASAQKLVKHRILSNSTIPFPGSPVDYFYYKDKRILTKEAVSFYESTSGSTGSKKLIPYTPSQLKSFQEMFLLWSHDLVFHSGLSLTSGKFFMSISPKIGEENKDDRKYLSPVISFLLNPFIVSHPDDHQFKTPDEFFFKISRDLLQNKNVEIISIWSPTYLLSVLKFIETHQEELGLKDCNWQQIWPELKLISCWTHGQATKSAEALRVKFPHVKIQPKGLILTEAPVTVPWTEANGALPLITETYFEFMGDGKLYEIQDLKVGETYTVITSQHNGYLRYNTQDEVKVTGMYFQTPVLEFIGRSGQYSDLAGEKFSETGLREVLSDKTELFFIVPDESGELPGYHLYTESEDKDWEEKLRTIYHYDLARKLNQLNPLIVNKVPDLQKMYIDFCRNEGMVLGDIKERILFNNLTQAKKFRAWIDKALQSSH